MHIYFLPKYSEENENVVSVVGVSHREASRTKAGWARKGTKSRLTNSFTHKFTQRSSNHNHHRNNLLNT